MSSPLSKCLKRKAGFPTLLNEMEIHFLQRSHKDDTVKLPKGRLYRTWLKPQPLVQIVSGIQEVLSL